MSNKFSKKITGVALSDSKDQTVKVETSFIKIHPIYQNRVSYRRIFLVHTDQEIKKGQKEVITPTKPMSKRKAWKVIQ